jgi:hypothetical protein
MYLVYNIDRIYYIFNESKKQIFFYIKNRMEFCFLTKSPYKSTYMAVKNLRIQVDYKHFLGFLQPQMFVFLI